MHTRNPTFTPRAVTEGKPPLWAAHRVSPRTIPSLEAYGGVDEINSWLGLCVAQLEEVGLKNFELHKDWLKDIQQDLFVLGSILACEEGRGADPAPVGTSLPWKNWNGGLTRWTNASLPSKILFCREAASRVLFSTWPEPVAAGWRGPSSPFGRKAFPPWIWPTSTACRISCSSSPDTSICIWAPRSAFGSLEVGNRRRRALTPPRPDFLIIAY